MSSLPSPVLKRYNSDNPKPLSYHRSSSGTTPLSIKITKHNHSFDNSMAASLGNNTSTISSSSASSNTSVSSPLKWRLGARKLSSSRRDSKDSASISSSENTYVKNSAIKSSGNNNINSTVLLTSPQSVTSKMNVNSPLQSRSKARNISLGSSASSLKNVTASPISNYEASRLYFKQSSRNSSASISTNNYHGSSPLSTPKSATYHHGVYDSGSSYSTINGTMDTNGYKPIPSPFDSSSFTKSPILQMIKSPIVNRKSSTSSFTSIIPKKIRSNLTNNVPESSGSIFSNKGKKIKDKLSDLDLNKTKFKRTSDQQQIQLSPYTGSSLSPALIPAPKSKPSISNFSHYSNSSSSHSQLYSLQQNSKTASNSATSVASVTSVRPVSSSNNLRTAQHAPQYSVSSNGTLTPSRSPARSRTTNLRDRNCIICDEKLEVVLQTFPNKVEKIIELRCDCFCHEDCLKSSIQFEKEKAIADGSKSLNFQKLPLIERAFPICFNCSGSIRAIPKNQDLIDELITEYVTYQPKPALIKNISSTSSTSLTSSNPSNTTSPFPSMFNSKPNVSKSQGKKLNLNTNFLTSPVHNPYQNVNSPSSSYNSYKTLSPMPKSAIANNPYIRNTLNDEPKKTSKTLPRIVTDNVTNIPTGGDIINDKSANNSNTNTSKNITNSNSTSNSGTKNTTTSVIISSASNTTANTNKVSTPTNTLPGHVNQVANHTFNSTSPPLFKTNALIRNVSPIPNKKHPQFQVQRQAPSPPINAESRHRLTKTRANSSTVSLDSPSKKAPLPYEPFTKNGSSSPLKRDSLRNKNNLFIDIPSKPVKTNESPEKKRSMHDLSYDILNESNALMKSSSNSSISSVTSPVSIGSNKKLFVNGYQMKATGKPVTKKKFAGGNRSRGSSVSAVSSVVSSVSRSPSPGPYEYSNSGVSRSNSLSSSYSAATSNTYSQHSISNRVSIGSLREKFTTHLRNNLKDGNKNLILSDDILETFGELRLVDNLLISINSMSTGKFIEKTVYLFKDRLLIINPNYDGFISLKLNLQAKTPKVEIPSTSIIKLDFNTNVSTLNRNISSTYISIEESKNDVIQKWVAALCDYECTFPPLIFTSTLHATLDELIGDGHLPITEDDEKSSIYDEDDDDDYDISTSKHDGIFHHNAGSQSTLNVGKSRQSINSYRRSAINNRLSSVGFSVRNKTPNTLIVCINSNKDLGNTEKSLLANIIKILCIKIPTIQVICTSNSFLLQYLNISSNETAKFELIGAPSSSKGTFFDINAYLKTYVTRSGNEASKETGVLLLSASDAKLPLKTNYAFQMCHIQIGESKFIGSAHGIITVPVWENLMEAICNSFHVSFDDDDDNSDDNSLSSDNEEEYLESDSDSDGDNELETAKLDLDEIVSKKQEDEKLLAQRIRSLELRKAGLSYKPERSPARLPYKSSSYQNKSYQQNKDSDSDESNYDSDDSTKEQLLKLKEKGILQNDEILNKYSKKQSESAVSEKTEDSDYYESEDSSGSESGFDSDDSTREQLQRINQHEILKNLNGKDDSEKDNSFSNLDKENTLEKLQPELLGPVDLEEEARMMSNDYDSNTDSNATSVRSSIRNSFKSRVSLRSSFNEDAKNETQGGFSRFNSRESISSFRSSTSTSKKANGLYLMKDLAKKIEQQDTLNNASKSSSSSPLSSGVRSCVRPVTVANGRDIVGKSAISQNNKELLAEGSTNSLLSTPKKSLVVSSATRATPGSVGTATLFSRSPTPRWSMLFEGIDKEWESLNDDDEGYMRYSKWKTLSLNGAKKP